MNKSINQLINYGLHQGLIMEEDIDYVLMKLKDILHFDSFKKELVEDEKIENILNSLSIEHQDKLIDCLLVRPSELYKNYRSFYKKSPQQATQYYYQFSKSSLNIDPNWENYLHEQRLDSDHFLLKVISYQGKSILNPPMLNKREMPISFNNEDKGWLLSYVFNPCFNEEAIVRRIKHLSWQNQDDMYNEMLNFLNKFPQYFIAPRMIEEDFDGTYQVGKTELPIERSYLLNKDKSNKVKVEMLDWPISVLKLIGNNENRLIDMIVYIENAWISLDPHNKVIPLMKLDGSDFNVYLALMNQSDLDNIDVLSLMGLRCVRAINGVQNPKEYLSFLEEKDSFKQDKNKFVSFVRKAI